MLAFQSVLARSARAATLALLLLAAPNLLWGQDDAQGPGQISVRLVDVKSGSVGEFEAAIAEVARASEAAGRPFFHVYQRLRGPDLPVYSIITLDGAFNELEPLDVGPSVFDRIGHSVNDSALMTLNIYPELGVPSGGVVPSGEYMYVRVRTTSPANQQAYFDWHAEVLTPAARDGGVTDLRAGRIILGGNTNTFVRFYYGDSPQTAAAGGGDLAESLGQRGFQQMIEREAALLVASEDYVYRFREDLSTTAAAQ